MVEDERPRRRRDAAALYRGFFNLLQEKKPQRNQIINVILVVSGWSGAELEALLHSYECSGICW